MMRALAAVALDFRTTDLPLFKNKNKWFVWVLLCSYGCVMVAM